MVGPAVWQTGADVEAAWRLWIDGDPANIEAWPPHRLISRERIGDYSRHLRESTTTIAAYISGGKWVADCPTCNGGVAAWPDHPRGCCLDCGTVYTVSFPAAAKIQQAAELLAPRSVNDSNWHPHRGETIDQLRHENELLAAAGNGDKIGESSSVDLATVKAVLGDNAIAELRRAGAI